MNYQFISDPGHGWLAVPADHIKALGIAEKITTYSYVQKFKRDPQDPPLTMVWLEEDCDLSTFLRAQAAAEHVDDANFRSWLSQFFATRVTEHTVNGDAHVRNLPRYVPERIAA